MDPVAYIGVGGALLDVIGYMPTEFGHYSVFQVPKYVTVSELFFFVLTLLGILSIFVYCLDTMMLGNAIRTFVDGIAGRLLGPGS